MTELTTTLNTPTWPWHGVHISKHALLLCIPYLGKLLCSLHPTRLKQMAFNTETQIQMESIHMLWIGTFLPLHPMTCNDHRHNVSLWQIGQWQAAGLSLDICNLVFENKMGRRAFNRACRFYIYLLPLVHHNPSTHPFRKKTIAVMRIVSRRSNPNRSTNSGIRNLDLSLDEQQLRSQFHGTNWKIQGKVRLLIKLRSNDTLSLNLFIPIHRFEIQNQQICLFWPINDLVSPVVHPFKQFLCKYNLLRQCVWEKLHFVKISLTIMAADHVTRENESSSLMKMRPRLFACAKWNVKVKEVVDRK